MRRARVLVAGGVAASAVAIVLAAGGGGGSGGGEGFTTANVWVDQNGGTCDYNATAREHTGAGDSESCSSFDAAYDEIRAATGASCGGRVLIRAGTYAGQTLTGYRTNCPTTEAGKTLFAPESFDCDAEEIPTSTPVTLTGSFGSGGSQGSVLNDAIGHVTICGITTAVSNVPNTTADGTTTNNSRWGFGTDYSRYVTFKRLIAGGFGLFQNGFDRGHAGTGNIEVLYSDIRDCHENKDNNNYVCTNGYIVGSEDVLIEGNLLRNFRSLDNCVTGGASDCGHWETIFLNGTDGVTIRRNRFFNYEQSAAIYTTCFDDGGDLTAAGICHRNLTIENNWAESPHTADQGGQDPGDGGEHGENAISVGGHCVGFSGTDYDNILVRNNTVVGAAGEIAFDGASGGGCVVGSGGVTVTGNIANKITNTAGCSQTNVTIDYNIGSTYSTGGNNACGANRHNGTLASSFLVEPTWASLTQDAHLSTGASVADGFVPEAMCPADDYDGDSRPADACDAGMDEFTG